MKSLSRLGWGVLILGAVALGLWGSRFSVYLANQVMILAIFSMGYNLLFGRSGLLSFGHGAFYALGAYGLGLFYLHVNTHPLLGIAVGVAAAAAGALIIGFFCVRHSEIYFAMLTLAFGMLVFSLIWNLREITGGDDGLVGIGRAPVDLGIISLPIARGNQFYFLVLIAFLGSCWVLWRLRNSPFGLVLAGLRENPQRVQFSALDIRRWRLAAFTISGAFAGLAGALSALLENNTDPFSAHWSHSAEPILTCLIGGMHTFFGPVVGSTIFVVLREVVERFTEKWELAFGVLLVIIILGFRGGIVGTLTRGRTASEG